MNILTAIFTSVFLLLVLLAFFKTGSVLKNKEQDEGTKKVVFWLRWSLGFIFLVSLIATIQMSGIVKMTDPFQGVKITNELGNFDLYYEGDVSKKPPELKSVPMKPDLDSVKEEHKQFLKEFEDSK